MKDEVVGANWRWLQGELNHRAVIELLTEHQQSMAENSPAESRHVLDIQALQQPEITFWSLWEGGELMGCVALKHWDDSMGEIKSMKTAPDLTGKGIGKCLLEHVIEVAKNRGYQKLKLETGTMAYFKPARQLYSSYGFSYCGPFGDYFEGRNNVYLQLIL